MSDAGSRIVGAVATLLTRRRAVVLTVVAACTLALGSQLPRLEVELR